MPLRNHTGIIPYRLTGPAGQRQTWQSGTELSWLMKSVKPLAGGKLCNHVLGLLVTVIASNVRASSLERPMSIREVVGRMIESIEVRNAWHGTPISAQHVKGSMLELIELVGNGMMRPYRATVPTVGMNDGGSHRVSFRHQLFIPLAMMAGRKGHHTALPALFYEDAEFVINCSNGLGGIFAEAATNNEAPASVNFDVSAICLPEDEIHVGPAVSWIDYQQKHSDEAIDINSMGKVSTLNNTEAGAGICGLFWLSSRFGLPGAGEVKSIQSITFPFRDIIHTKHVDPLIEQFENLMGGQENPAIGTDLDVSEGYLGMAGDVAGFPYGVADYGTGAGRRNPAVLALVCPSLDLELTKVQKSEGTQQLQMQFDGPVGGTHHLLAQQVQSWTPEAWLSAKEKLVKSGVARAVLGTDDVDWSVKLQNKQDPTQTGMNERKFRFLPLKLVRKQVATVKVA